MRQAKRSRPGIGPGILVHGGVGVQDIDQRQVVPLGHLEVHRVVGRGDLDGAGAEGGVDGFIGDDGYLAVDGGQDDLLADHRLEALVVGVDGHGRIAEDGLRAGGGHGNKLAFALRQRIADIVEVAGYVLVVDLQVGEGGGAARAPVDDALAAVDQPLVVEADEGGAHRPARSLVQGEALASPVAGDAQPLVLLGDGLAALRRPLPHPLQEFLSAQLVAVSAFFGQLPLHHHLGGDAGMVDAGQPEGRLALHAVPADHNVFQGSGQGMAEVQLAGDIGRRHDDDEGLLLRVYFGREIALLHPELVPLLLDLARLIGLGHFCSISVLFLP